MSSGSETLSSDESGFLSRLGGKEPSRKEKPKKDETAPSKSAPVEKGRPSEWAIPASLRQRWEDLKEELHGELLGRLNFEEVEGLDESELAGKLRPSVLDFVKEALPHEFS